MQITQMNFRLSEGAGECFYYVGIEDAGYPRGLSDNDMRLSLNNLHVRPCHHASPPGPHNLQRAQHAGRRHATSGNCLCNQHSGNTSRSARGRAGMGMHVIRGC